ncbi:MAG TPA: hypothetical protein VE990_03050 [Acidimicrobiales bacterium]|nr:hypothetical protein [Acidimicrobiales bacterium]
MADAGQVAGVEMLFFGALIFVVGILVVANAWGVLDAKLVAGDAAREAAWAFVQAGSQSAASAAALDAADQAVSAHGRDPSHLSLQIDGTLARCHRVVAQASYRTVLISLPWVGALAGSFTASARHSELVDPYRSGLPVSNAACAG